MSGTSQALKTTPQGLQHGEARGELGLKISAPIDFSPPPLLLPPPMAFPCGRADFWTNLAYFCQMPPKIIFRFNWLGENTICINYFFTFFNHTIH